MVRQLSPFTRNGWPEVQKFWKSPPSSPAFAVELIPDLPSGLVSPENYNLFLADGHVVHSRCLIIRDPQGRPVLRIVDQSRNRNSAIRIEEMGDTLSIADSGCSDDEPPIIARVDRAMSVTSWVKRLDPTEFFAVLIGSELCMLHFDRQFIYIHKRTEGPHSPPVVIIQCVNGQLKLFVQRHHYAASPAWLNCSVILSILLVRASNMNH